jgi:hypothetical protein
MSIVVKLEDDLGEHSEWVLVHGVVPAREDRAFPFLRCVDCYGRTVFNHLQMESFLEEWERVRDRARDDTQRDAWQMSRIWPWLVSKTTTFTCAL